ncbi:hypothetical protein N7491_010676 [Penicillium cf. griseofulvum]|nr:hypothetical protein N7491_010676 [Penicillium cf. griseofulvum]KAJ5428414.1 hypothetical protein N7445_009868 [Penicillium cf. griseofulvum]
MTMRYRWGQNRRATGAILAPAVLLEGDRCCKVGVESSGIFRQMKGAVSGGGWYEPKGLALFESCVECWV